MAITGSFQTARRAIFGVLHSVLFWFVVNAVLLLFFISIRIEIFALCCELDDDIFNVLSSFLTGGLISFLFYFLVVFLPARRRGFILKRNILSLYKYMRRDVVVSVVMASIKGGRSDLSMDWEELERLTDIKEFRASFSEGRESDEGFYAFENQMSDRTYEFEAIIKSLKLLSFQLDFFLHNHIIEDGELFALLKGFEFQLLSLLDSQAGYDESKPLCGFIYQWLAGWDPITGYRDRDLFLEALQRA